MQYRVMWDYRSGPVILHAAEVVEIDDSLASWLLSDSPGVITPLVESEPAERAPDAPAQDRMHRGGRKRGN